MYEYVWRDSLMNKVAFVTGGGRGIGRGIVLELARAGYDVGILYSTSAEGAQTVCGLVRDMGRKASVYQADIRDLKAFESTFEQFKNDFGRLDVMVNNAGITRFSPFLETTPEMFEEVMHTDFRGAYFGAQYAARFMVEQKNPGVIINICSNHAKGCWPKASVYGPIKAALVKFVENAALELARYDIRVVGIAPGYTWLKLDQEQPPRWEGRINSRIPMGEWATPEQVGQAVVFLSSAGAKVVTGTTLYMDGGALLPVLAENAFV
jgi:NAD(P)-dependent dehydrogenase (short-subunit alcohol dehydrogenase family)